MFVDDNEINQINDQKEDLSYIFQDMEQKEYNIEKMEKKENQFMFLKQKLNEGERLLIYMDIKTFIEKARR